MTDTTTAPGTFVEYVGMAHAPGPLEITGVTMWAHLFEANEDKLRRLLARVFDDTTAGAVECEPAMDRVLLTLTRLKEIRTRERGYGAMGYNRESNVAFWVPTVVKPRGEPSRFAMFLAGMWVSDPIALVAGREVWGYPKHYGTIRLPDEGDGTAQLNGWVWNFEDGECPREQPLLTLTPDGAEADLERVEDDALDRALAPFHALEEHHVDEGVDRNLVPDFLGWRGDALECVLEKKMPQLVLRQSRDPRYGAAASGPANGGALPWNGCGDTPPASVADHQQVTLSEAKISSLDVDVIPGGASLEIVPYDSHPISEHLGLEDRPSWIKGLRLEMEFAIHRAEVLWSLPEPS